MFKLSQVIKQKRKDINLSQTDFAELLGFSRSYIAQIEADKKAPSREFLEKFSSKFKDIKFKFEDAKIIAENVHKNDNLNVHLNDNKKLSNDESKTLEDFKLVEKKFHSLINKFLNYNELNNISIQTFVANEYMNRYFTEKYWIMVEDFEKNYESDENIKEFIHKYRIEIQDFKNLIKVYSSVYKALKEANDYFEDNYDRLKLYRPDF